LGIAADYYFLLVCSGVDVRRFDADIIPLDGSSGLLGRVERLLDKAPTRHVSTREKRELLDDLLGIVRETEW
jgi:hypothetical protein